MADQRRAIPSLERLLASPEMNELLVHEPRTRVVQALRTVQENMRQDARASIPTEASWYAQEVKKVMRAQNERSLRPLINATGVVLHTNLGRAPLAEAAIEALTEVARGYSNLEYDLGRGTRGSRYLHCTRWLLELSGAEAALVVNNNAAALVLALNTLALGRPVIVSRGELVEIGGSFRIPDIIARSGAFLHEVGATNRTHLQDYAMSIEPETGAILKVHQSNFRITGYTSEVAASELAALARARGIPFVHDLGSGLLEDLSDAGLKGETSARAALNTGADLVTMSGDKLLGGPQAGIILGRADLVAALKSNPLCRALRVDKLTIAALEATLALYVEQRARQEIPVLRTLSATAEQLRTRAERVVQRLREVGINAQASSARSTVGGGAYPGVELESTVVAVLVSVSAAELEQLLRTATPPVIARIIDDRVTLDLRTVLPEQEDLLVSILRSVV